MGGSKALDFRDTDFLISLKYRLAVAISSQINYLCASWPSKCDLQPAFLRNLHLRVLSIKDRRPHTSFRGYFAVVIAWVVEFLPKIVRSSAAYETVGFAFDLLEDFALVAVELGSMIVELDSVAAIVASGCPAPSDCELVMTADSCVVTLLEAETVTETKR